MNTEQAIAHYASELAAIKAAGTYKEERVLLSPQRETIDTNSAQGVINMCANNYLGLCDHPALIGAAKAGLDEWGFGLSSVRFICGTTALHKTLEARLSAFLGMEDTILYASCFDANGGLFETLLTQEDAIISDHLNHASIIDGIRLCKAQRFRYKNNDLKDLERCLQEAKAARIKLIVTDGVFSMDGIVANLQGICALKETYGALLMVDDSHAVGFMGEGGRGSVAYCRMEGHVDILTGTLGKALGGASGGYTSARREIVELLRQRSRPYLFSNTLAPSIAAASLQALALMQASSSQRERLFENTRYFREQMERIGFDIIKSEHPIVAVMLYDAPLAGQVASRLLELGVYVVAFSYPVVPANMARIRVQLSAAHTKENLDAALAAFRTVKKELLP